LALCPTPVLQTNRRTAAPYSGWALELAIELDQACPGLLAESFRFGRQRRQALFLVLALAKILGIDKVADHLRSAEGLSEFASAAPTTIFVQAVLRFRRPRDLVRAVLVGPPVGLLGTLARLGDDPIGEPRDYYECARLFMSKDPADRRRAKILGQISGDLVGPQLEIVGKLDPILLHPALVAKLHDLDHVEEVHQALAYTRTYCTWASDDAIRASLGRLRPEDSRGTLIKSWANRFDRLPHELDTRGDPTLVVLATAGMMAAAGKKYRNCLKSKVSEAFLGSTLFVEYRPSDAHEPGAIAVLRRIDAGFFLEGLFAAENRRVRADRAGLIRRKLMACGVAVFAHAPGDPAVVRTTARMLGQWALGDPDNDGWGEEPLDADEGLQQALAEIA
jgi:hypothetical protein